MTLIFTVMMICVLLLMLLQLMLLQLMLLLLLVVVCGRRGSRWWPQFVLIDVKRIVVTQMKRRNGTCQGNYEIDKFYFD